MNKCINCQSRKKRVLEKINKKNFKTTIIQCTECGLTQRWPMPTKKSLFKLYKKFYMEKHYSLKKQEESCPKEMYQKIDKKIEQEKIKRLENFVKKGKLLDVGVGKGFFVSELSKRRNWEVYGIEYSKSAVNEVNKKTKIKVKHGEVTQNFFPNNFFDVITMNSVLEHIPDQKSTLRSVNKQLKKNGYFILNLPNINSFEFYIYNKILKKSYPAFIPQHLYYYNPQSINELLQKSGFEVTKITSNHPEKIRTPGVRPLRNIALFPLKFIFDHTTIGGWMKIGNGLFIYAKKIKDTK